MVSGLYGFDFRGRGGDSEIGKEGELIRRWGVFLVGYYGGERRFMFIRIF